VVTKVPSPFASLFAKTLLAIFWVVYAGMLVALVVGRDLNLLIIAGWWTFCLPWITWCFLSGVKVEPGRSVGGGPMYPRVVLEPGEDVLFQAPAYVVPSAGHLFVTDQRVIVAPIRFLRGARSVRLSDLTAVEIESKGFGWPLPRRSVRLRFASGSLTIRPWSGPDFAGDRFSHFMGMVSADEFVEGLLAALRKGGVPQTST
jgi:hypothetical protein